MSPTGSEARSHAAQEAPYEDRMPARSDDDSSIGLPGDTGKRRGGTRPVAALARADLIDSERETVGREPMMALEHDFGERDDGHDSKAGQRRAFDEGPGS